MRIAPVLIVLTSPLWMPLALVAMLWFASPLGRRAYKEHYGRADARRLMWLQRPHRQRV